MKKSVSIVWFLTIFLFSLCGCAQAENESVLVNAFALKESGPPVLKKIVAEDEDTVRIVFDKSVTPIENSFLPYSAAACDMAVIVSFDTSMKADREYVIEGLVEDNFGNTSYIKCKIWGYNPDPAKLLINEFTTKSSGKQIDRTELLVTKKGLTSGFVLYDGIPENYRAKTVLGDLQVQKGDYIVVWWCSSLPDDIAFHPSEHVWNICAKSSGTPSENNGIQTITVSPSQGSEVLDCVVYSSFESSQFSGYGTKEVFERVQKAISGGWWSGPAISSNYSTGTRSMFRLPNQNDSNTCNEWNICATGGATFGSENLTESY